MRGFHVIPPCTLDSPDYLIASFWVGDILHLYIRLHISGHGLPTYRGLRHGCQQRLALQLCSCVPALCPSNVCSAGRSRCYGALGRFNDADGAPAVCNLRCALILMTEILLVASCLPRSVLNCELNLGLLRHERHDDGIILLWGIRAAIYCNDLSCR